MNANLLYRNKDFEWERKLTIHQETFILDLELNTIFQEMSQGNEEVYEIVKKVICNSLLDLDEITFRQEVLKDCINQFSIVNEINSIIESVFKREKESHQYSLLSDYPSEIVSQSKNRMLIFMEELKKLRRIAIEKSINFHSEGFCNLFRQICDELPDDYFEEIQAHLKKCNFQNGIVISTKLGKGNKNTGYIMREPKNPEGKWYQNIFHRKENMYSFRLAPNDESGAKALSELLMKGLNPIANSLAQSADHIHNFFVMLRNELSFYMGCVYLKKSIEDKEKEVIFPYVENSEKRKLSFSELCDIALLLTKKGAIVGNECNLTDKTLVIITGANQGGKTTFLRSLGQSQVMMQAGMYVGAKEYTGSIFNGIYTHFKKEEDSEMKSGKLDEELDRMNDIVDSIKGNAGIFFNESFSATNEKEGSEIANQITNALLEKNIRVYYVTHFYKFSSTFASKAYKEYEFLKAERSDNGTRNYKIQIGPPLKTSYGMDLYEQIFVAQE